MSLETQPAARRPKTLILDGYGRYAPQFRGWLPVADLVHLMGLLDIDEQAVRSAVSRMTRRGLLRKEVRDRVRGYATTAEADDLLADGDRRIFASMDPARLDEGWVLLSFSLPETERDKRHVLRSKLMWLGMGMASSGLWIAPARTEAMVVETVEALGVQQNVDIFLAHHRGFGDVSSLVNRAWDVDGLARMYAHFLETHGPVERRLARRRGPLDGAEAFSRYTLALHDWRKFPYLDPGLPAELLPARWPGREAAQLFSRLRSELEPAAISYAAETVRHVDAPSPI